MNVRFRQHRYSIHSPLCRCRSYRGLTFLFSVRPRTQTLIYLSNDLEFLSHCFLILVQIFLRFYFYIVYTKINLSLFFFGFFNLSCDQVLILLVYLRTRNRNYRHTKTRSVEFTVKGKEVDILLYHCRRTDDLSHHYS